MITVHVVLHHWQYEDAEAVAAFEKKEDAEKYSAPLNERASHAEWWDVTELTIR